MNLFVDMDGVLADFARHHEAVFGWRPETGTMSTGPPCARSRTSTLTFHPWRTSNSLDADRAPSADRSDWRSGDRRGALQQACLGVQTSRPRSPGPLLPSEREMEAWLEG